MTSTAQRWITLDGAVNVRDLGGLPTLDGGTTASGRLLRADNLQDLTPADVRRLVDELRVRLVLDLRTEVELRLEGSAPLEAEAAVRHRHLSLLPVVGQATDLSADVLPWARDARRSIHRRRGGPEVISRLYRQYLRDRPDSVVDALQAITELPDGAALVHCAAGKDRTGVVVALALSVAGVTRDAVVADYAASADVVAAIVDRLLASPTYAEDIAARPADSHRPLAASMTHFLDLLTAEDGGLQGWLTGHGFGPADQARLRERLTA